eukprot:Tbor_TRINITY_DN5779_c0_g1::TRINITY_DN5779_c0_g1_i1::g.19901::m.19901
MTLLNPNKGNKGFSHGSYMSPYRQGKTTTDSFSKFGFISSNLSPSPGRDIFCPEYSAALKPGSMKRYLEKRAERVKAVNWKSFANTNDLNSDRERSIFNEGDDRESKNRNRRTDSISSLNENKLPSNNGAATAKNVVERQSPAHVGKCEDSSSSPNDIPVLSRSNKKNGDTSERVTSEIVLDREGNDDKSNVKARGRSASRRCRGIRHH